MNVRLARLYLPTSPPFHLSFTPSPPALTLKHLKRNYHRFLVFYLRNLTYLFATHLCTLFDYPRVPPIDGSIVLHRHIHARPVLSCSTATVPAQLSNSRPNANPVGMCPRPWDRQSWSHWDWRASESPPRPFGPAPALMASTCHRISADGDAKHRIQLVHHNSGQHFLSAALLPLW